MTILLERRILNILKLHDFYIKVAKIGQVYHFIGYFTDRCILPLINEKHTDS